MGIFGIWVIGEGLYKVLQGSEPIAQTMGLLGVIALVVNVFVALILFKFRDGDSNMQSVWICSRNDAIGNIAVILAAGIILVFKSPWPDLVVAFIMGYLGISGSLKVFKKAILEYRT